MEIQENITLAPYTTLGVGGPARYFVTVTNVDDLKEAAAFAREHSLPLLILGGGSNVVIADDGFEGLAVLIDICGVAFSDAGDGIVEVRGGAGESWDELVAVCVERGLYGIENLSGIPGTVGAAPMQNIGAYGTEVSDVFVSASVFDPKSGDVREFSPSDCKFGYRDSVFKSSLGRHLIVVEVVLRLKTDGELNTSYKGVRNYLEQEGINNPTLQDMRKVIIEIRAQKGMVLLPGYETYKLAGSFFKNPIVSTETYERIKEKYPDIPIEDIEEFFYEAYSMGTNEGFRDSFSMPA